MAKNEVSKDKKEGFLDFLNFGNINWSTWILILGALGVGAYFFIEQKEGTLAQTKIESLQKKAQGKEEEAKRLRSIAEKLQSAEQAREQYKKYKEEAGAL